MPACVPLCLGKERSILIDLNLTQIRLGFAVDQMNIMDPALCKCGFAVAKIEVPKPRH